MSLSSYNEKHLEDNDLQEDLNHLESGQNKDRPGRKLLQGTVQFYDRILDSLEESFITVFNESGKHIEVWSDPRFKELTGVNPFEFKGRLLGDVYDEQAANSINKWIKAVFETGKKISKSIALKFTGNTLWFRLTLKALPGSDPQKATVVGYFQNITQTVELRDEIKQIKEDKVSAGEQEFEGSILLNHNGIVASVNKPLLDLSGFSEADFLGYKINRIPVIPSNYLSSMQKIYEQAREGNIPLSIELQWQNYSKQTIWSEVFAKPVLDKNKQIQVKIYFKDISGRKFIEKDLLKSKQAYKIIIENAREAIFVIQDGKVKFSNSQLLDLMDYSLDELLKTPFPEFIHPDDRGAFQRLTADRLYEPNGNCPNTLRLLRKDKSFKWISAKSVYIEWDSKPATLLYFVDISEDKLSEESGKRILSEYKLLSEKAIAFGTLTDDSEIFRFTSERMIEISSVTSVLMISYDPLTSIPKVEYIEGPADVKENLKAVIENNTDEFPGKINHELIRNISYGKLIKYNDGLFEQGYNIFPKNTFNLIQKVLNVNGIYLIGLTHGKTVYGTALIFTHKGKKLGHSGAIETIAKLASASLKRRESLNILEKSEQNYRRIFESYQDIYFRTDIEGVISQVSPSIKTILGFEKKEVEGKLISHFFRNQLQITSFAKELLRVNSFTDRDIQLVSKGQEIVYASLSAVIVRDENKTTVGFEGFIRNISERKKAEDLFQKSEEKFRTLADFTYGWEYWLSPEGKVIYMSPSCKRISGFDVAEFTEDPELLNEIIYKDDRGIINELQKKHKEEGSKIIKTNFRIRTKDNNIKWISHTRQELRNKDGAYLGFRVSNRDITERKLAEEELINSEERFKTLFVDSPDAIVVEDYKGNILDINPAAGRLLKYKQEKLKGKNIATLIPEESSEEVTSHFPQWISGELQNIRSFLQTSSGETIPVEIHGNKIIYSGQNALLFIIRDITEVTEKEKKLKESVEKAEESDMLKSAFLANVSHEIRTPMNAIIGFSEILTNPDLTQKEREEFIRYITQGSNTLMTLIEDIIDITKIEAGQIKIDFDQCKVDELLDELYATFLKMKNKNGKSGVELRMKKPIVEKGFTIFTDPHRIRQIFSNLLGNALKFTKKGYIEFGFNLRGPENIVFYVQDTGIGIPANKLDLIFTRFGQVENNKSQEHKGTGLGLSISKKLAELLDGDLSVTSEVDKGSTFYLSLPVNKELEIEKVLDKKPVTIQLDWSNKLFLIAEDSILNYTFLEALFQKTHVKLLWAKNGKEAVDMCKKNENIDLVLMDIKMPILGGLEAISEIKKFRKDLPIVVQTAYAMPEDRERSLAAGGDEHLNKPINPDELFTTIAQFIK
ncbi:MAG: PAS domain S-box protein [Bacteroidales bacterium]|nr:PAS domain S-box protein [Bacteroidales bacterium]